MKTRRSGSHSPKTLLQAVAFAVFVVGALSVGLGLSTYTVAKANELVFGPVLAEAAMPSSRCVIE